MLLDDATLGYDAAALYLSKSSSKLQDASQPPPPPNVSFGWSPLSSRNKTRRTPSCKHVVLSQDYNVSLVKDPLCFDVKRDTESGARAAAKPKPKASTRKEADHSCLHSLSLLQLSGAHCTLAGGSSKTSARRARVDRHRTRPTPGTWIKLRSKRASQSQVSGKVSPKRTKKNIAM